MKAKYKLIRGDCLEVMKKIPDGFVDLTVTSPPYDNLRSYNGNNEQWSESVWKGIIRGLYRVTAIGGVVVWVVNDATIKGSETGTSFRQALYFKECGFNLHDTMIYSWAGTGAKGSRYSYWQGFEYMFILSKGKPKSINLIKDHENKKPGKKSGPTQGPCSNGTRKFSKIITRPKYSIRNNMWAYGGSVGKKTKHPAQFPEKLAHDHIISWSNENDIVLDPMMGSGTTGVACLNTNRRFVGIEKDEEYFNITKERINHLLEEIRI